MLFLFGVERMRFGLQSLIASITSGLLVEAKVNVFVWHRFLEVLEADR